MTLLDQYFSSLKPLSRPPRQRDKTRFNLFVRNLNLQSGKLYQIKIKMAWVYGDMSNPHTLGDRENSFSQAFTTNENAVFMFLDHEFVHWIDSLNNQNYWLAMFKCIVEDKVGYFPIPPEAFNDNKQLEQEFADILVGLTD